MLIDLSFLFFMRPEQLLTKNESTNKLLNIRMEYFLVMNLIKAFNFKRPHSAINSTGNDALVVCPLCETHKPFSDRVFHRSNLERFLTIGNANAGSNTGRVAHGKRIDIDDLARNEDLSCMRRQIIGRCTEIIKKLAADT